MDKKVVNTIPEEAPQEKQTFPTEVITLPSHGWFYSSDNPLAKGQIELYLPTAKHEDILTSKNLIKKGVVIDKFLEAVIATPINYDSMLLGDKNGIMMAARMLAYGPMYNTKITCMRCEVESEKEIDLTTMKAKEIDFNNFQKDQQEFELHLPKINKTIILKLLTHKDIQDINEEQRQMKKFAKYHDKLSTTNMKYQIISVDGNRDRNRITKFVENELFMQDSLKIKEFLNEITPDIDAMFNFKCDNMDCELEKEIPLPMGVQFFYPAAQL